MCRRERKKLTKPVKQNEKNGVNERFSHRSSPSSRREEKEVLLCVATRRRKVKRILALFVSSEFGWRGRRRRRRETCGRKTN